MEGDSCLPKVLWEVGGAGILRWRPAPVSSYTQGLDWAGTVAGAEPLRNSSECGQQLGEAQQHPYPSKDRGRSDRCQTRPHVQHLQRKGTRPHVRHLQRKGHLHGWMQEMAYISHRTKVGHRMLWKPALVKSLEVVALGYLGQLPFKSEEPWLPESL